MEAIKFDLTYTDMPWRRDLPGFLKNYFSAFLLTALNESYNDGKVLESHLQPSLLYAHSLGIDIKYIGDSTLDNFFNNFNSFFSTIFCFGQKIPHALEKSLWWALFNNTESHLKANSCLTYGGKDRECFGDTFLGFKTGRNGDSKVACYNLSDVEWLGWKLSGETLDKYGGFIRTNF